MKNLIHFINQHADCKVESVNGDKLTVSCVGVDRDNNASRESQVIDATWTAARDYLGY